MGDQRVRPRADLCSHGFNHFYGRDANTIRTWLLHVGRQSIDKVSFVCKIGLDALGVGLVEDLIHDLEQSCVLSLINHS